MKKIVISFFLLFTLLNYSFGQLELLFTEHPLPSEINCIDDGCELKNGKIPKIIRLKIVTPKDTTHNLTKYNREGKYLGSDEGNTNFDFEEYITKINNDTFAIFKKTEGNLKLDYKIVFEKIGDTIKKDCYFFPNGALYNSHLFDSKSKRLIYFEQPYGDELWYNLNVSYIADTAYVNYECFLFGPKKLSFRMFLSKDVLNIDYFDVKNRIYKNEQFYKIGNVYFPKSLYQIDSLNNVNYSFENPKITNNNCDSILFHTFPINRNEDQLSQWIIIKKNKKGDITYQKQLANAYEKEVEIMNTYYKFGKRSGDLKEKKIIRGGELILYKRKIKYYLFPKNPIDKWLKKNT